MINLYSDTQTLPTEGMYAALREAPLGDDVRRADPTVNRLEAEVARLFEKEAALFLPSGTMANLVALMVHGAPGSEVFLEGQNHVYLYEAGGLASVAGYLPTFFQTRRGLPDPASFREAIRPADDHFPRPRLLWLENTHNASGGRVLPPELQAEMVSVAREHDLAVHVDGARIFNAAAALERPVSALAEDVDTVSFCLSKGLSCPAGSLLVGPETLIDEARRVRKRLGGGLRQAGILAACGLEALQTQVPRLEEDHRNARRLAGELARLDGLSLDPSEVQTNMVLIDTGSWSLDAPEATRRLEEEGVLVSWMDARTLRLVTHRHFREDQVSEVVRAFEAVLASEA